MSHSLYMNRCFQLARLGSGYVAPNPLVGAVLVYNQEVIAEGYHMNFGGPHAEVMALKQVTDPAILKKSILYVNLEPCSHKGKTPPCTNLIIEKGIKQVVISNRDPFPEVNGSGIMQLEKAGVRVTQGIMEKEGAFLNRRFFTFHTKKRPYIVMKWAQTKNGFMAPASQPGPKTGITWISNPASRLLVHLWRSQEQAILIGKGTVQSDNPRLNVRGITGTDPIRIIIDPKLTLSTDHHVFDKSVTTFIFNFLKQSLENNIRYIKLPVTTDMIPSLMSELYKENIQSVLIEGGATTINHFITNGLWDEARIFAGEQVFDAGVHAPVIKGLLTEQHNVAGDLLSIYFNQREN